MIHVSCQQTQHDPTQTISRRDHVLPNKKWRRLPGHWERVDEFQLIFQVLKPQPVLRVVVSPWFNWFGGVFELDHTQANSSWNAEHSENEIAVGIQKRDLTLETSVVSSLTPVESSCDSNPTALFRDQETINNMIWNLESGYTEGRYDIRYVKIQEHHVYCILRKHISYHNITGTQFQHLLQDVLHQNQVLLVQVFEKHLLMSMSAIFRTSRFTAVFFNAKCGA